MGKSTGTQLPDAAGGPFMARILGLDLEVTRTSRRIRHMVAVCGVEVFTWSRGRASAKSR